MTQKQCQNIFKKHLILLKKNLKKNYRRKQNKFLISPKKISENHIKQHSITKRKTKTLKKYLQEEGLSRFAIRLVKNFTIKYLIG